MKKLNLLITVIMLSTGAAFGQLTCSSAVQINSNPSCMYSSYVISGTEFWLKFTAQSKWVNVQVITTQFGVDAPHVHGISMYAGPCNNLQEIASDELAFFNSAGLLQVDLDATALIIGNIYYIELRREANGGTPCPRPGCFPVINPAAFDLCIEEISVFIPPDLAAEPAAPYHTYYKNRGQLLDFNGFPAKGVKLYTLNANPAVYIGDFMTSFVFSDVDEDVNVLDDFQRVDMTLLGASPTRVFKTEQTPDRVNHYLPHIPRGITDTKGFSRAVCNDVYSKTDMHFYSNPTGVKFYFIVRPGEASPDQITMKFDGATSTSITPTQFGDGLKIETGLGNLVLEKAHVYRIHPTNNNIVPMPNSGDFVQSGPNEYKFDIGNYPSTWTLVIAVDKGHSLPTPAIDNLVWSTYWGSIGWEFFRDIKTDDAGNTYICGKNWQGGFPAITGPQTVNAGSDDGIIIKLNDICEPQWATYYGGDTLDQCWSIAADNTGDVYVTGITYARTGNFPFDVVCGGVYCDTINDCTTGSCAEAFIIRLNSAGVREWATFYGEDNVHEQGWDLALNSQRDVYVVGEGNAFTDLVVEAGAFNDTKGTGLIMKFDTLAARQWVTLIGATNGIEDVKGVAIDNNDNVYITGRTFFPATDFPIVNAGGNATHAGPLNGFDAYATRFDVNDSIIWSTFIGGSADNQAEEIAVNEFSVYIVGKTDDGMLLVDAFGNNDYFEGAWSGGTGAIPTDAFISEIDNSVNVGSLIWSTYIGSQGDDKIFDISIADNNFIYVVGQSISGNFLAELPFPTQNPLNFFEENSHETTGLPQTEGFVMAFKPNRGIAWTTYIGSGPQNNDGVNGVATVGDSILYTAGLIFGGTNTHTDYPLVDFNTGNPNDYYQDTTPNFSATANRWDISGIATVGIAEESGINGNFLIYPNPSDGQFTMLLNLKGQQDVKLRVYNILGGVVYNEDYGQLNGMVRKDFHLKVSTGMYAVELEIGDERMSEKLIIR